MDLASVTAANQMSAAVLFAAQETFDVGEDTGTKATESYQTPFRFTGKLKRVRIDLP